MAPSADFDVFLSHNSADKPEVIRLAEQLRARGLQPWIDAWELVPGVDWQDGLAAGLRRSRACAVFLGAADLGAWQRPEVKVALDRAARDGAFRVFLVLLRGTPEPFDPTQIDPFLSMRTWVDLRDAAGTVEVKLLVRAIQGLPIMGPARNAADVETSPYRGLLPFGEADSGWFFGRDADIQRLVEKLKSTQFLAVVGPSGSGKSSLALAGLLPALRGSAVPGSESWRYVTIHPGPRPLESLASALLAIEPGLPASQLVDELHDSDAAFSVRVATADCRVLVTVDQAEEVFTLSSGEQASRFFGNLLHASVPGGPCTVVLTMRADFSTRAADLPAFAQALSAHQYLVGPLDRIALRQVIEQPALLAGLTLQPGLTEVVLDDVADQPGALPLLEHALLEVWERRQDGVLTVDGYVATGGVQGALALRAEHIWHSFTPSAQHVARHLLLRLIQPGEGSEMTRRPATLDEVVTSAISPTELDTVLTELSTARLVTTSGGPPATVEVAHEALIRAWPRLRGWVEEERDALRYRQRISDATIEWRQQRGDDLLWRGARLQAAREWAQARPAELNELEVSFLEASARHERDEIRGRRRWTVTALAVIGALLVAGTFVALFFAARERSSRAEAEELLLLSEARRLAIESDSRRDTATEAATLLAIESLSKADTDEGRDALARALTVPIMALGPVAVHDRAITSVAIDPTSSLVVSGGEDGVIRTWDADSGQPAGELGPFDFEVWAVAIDPTGTLLAAIVGQDQHVSLWDLTTRQPVDAPGDVDGGPLAVLTFGPDGRLIATATANGEIYLLDLDRGTVRLLFDAGDVAGGSDNVAAVAFNPDGSRLAVASGLLIEWDLERDAIVSTRVGPSEPQRRFTGVGYTARGSLIASEAGWEEGLPGLVVEYRLDDDDSWFELQRYADGVNALAVNGDVFVAAGARGEVRPSPAEGDINASGYVPTAAAISADGALIAAGTAEGNLLVWDVSVGGALRARQQTVASAGSLYDGFGSIAVGGDTVALGAGTSIELLTSPELSPIRTVRPPGDAGVVLDVALDAQAEQLAFIAAAAQFDSQFAVVQDVRSGAEIGRMDLGDLRTSLVFAGPDRLAVADESGVHMWDPVTGDVRTIVLPNELVPTGLAFDDKHGRLAVSMGTPEDAGSVIEVYDVADDAEPRPEPIAIIDGREPMTFTPDGGTLVHRRGSQVAASDVATEQTRLLGPPIDPVAIAVDARSRYVAASSFDGRLTMIDLARGVAVGTPFAAHETAVDTSMDVSTSPDGSTVLSVGSLEPVVVTWWYPDGWPDAACASVRRNLSPAEWVAVFLDEPRRPTCAQYP